MKRPEGFDVTPAEPVVPGRQAKTSRPTGAQTGGTRRHPAATASTPKLPTTKRSPSTPPVSGKVTKTKSPPLAKPSAGASAREKARQARKAARGRRRFEREEVRRFTRRSRNRRAIWISAVATILALAGVVAIAVYSPILALSKIEITGASVVNPEEILDAVDGQLGTPLALVDADRITKDLQQFTLIQSYVTETVPPNTLVIHVTERKPVGAIVTAGGFTVVDPAGVVVESVDERPTGIPAIELAGADTGSEVFDSVVEVILALPDSVMVHVDRVTAESKDDVTLVFTTGQRAVWGSADRSDLKARVLARLMATQSASSPLEYDVSAPLNAVIRPS